MDLTATANDGVIQAVAYYAIITHRHGDDILIAGSQTSIHQQIADYCRANTHELNGTTAEAGDFQNMEDTNVIETYFSFSHVHNETYASGERKIWITPSPEKDAPIREMVA